MTATPPPADPAPNAPQTGGGRDWSRLSLGALLGLAVLTGVVAGVVAVYVNGAPGDNAETACAAGAARLEAVRAAAQGEVAAFAVLDEPRPAPELTFGDAEGTARQLSQWRGRTVLLNLWATWCAPCREEMPMLDALQGAEGGPGFEVVAVSIDTRQGADPAGFLQEVGVERLAFFHDPTAGVFNTLRREGLAFGMPTTLLIDADGCLAGWLAGPAHWDHPDAVALVDAVRAAR